MSATDLATLEDKIASRISPEKTNSLMINTGMGGLVIKDVSQLLEFAKIMAIGGVSVPKHLRGNPGACIACILQAIEWRMSPFAVANKSYAVNDRLAYEAQLIHAVLLLRAPIKGRPRFEYDGEGARRRCTVTATLLPSQGGDDVDYTSPEIGKIPIQNSPLWKNDPDQQLGYYSVRALARRHFPDVILGVVEREEARYNAIDGEFAETAPEQPRAERKNLAAKLEALAEAGIEEELAAVDEMVEQEREIDEWFERLKPAALRGPKALRLALGKLTTEEALGLSEETHNKLDAIAASAIATSANATGQASEP